MTTFPAFRAHSFAFSVLLATAFLLMSCEGQDDSGRELSELRRYDASPEVEIGVIYWQTDLSPGEQREAVEPVAEALEKVVRMVYNRNLESLPEMVHPQDGLYVDLKAHRTLPEVREAVADPESYLNVYFLDTDALRAERPEDPDRISVRDVLRLTRTLQGDFYMSRDGDFCEVRLTLKDAPSRSYFLNNPVFIKENGEWYVHRLF